MAAGQVLLGAQDLPAGEGWMVASNADGAPISDLVQSTICSGVSWQPRWPCVFMSPAAGCDLDLRRQPAEAVEGSTDSCSVRVIPATAASIFPLRQARKRQSRLRLAAISLDT
jgi:hypothetical protein